MMADLVWTINAVVFAALCLVWKREDMLNFSLKAIFLGMAIINAAPAWKFLQRAF